MTTIDELESPFQVWKKALAAKAPPDLCLHDEGPGLRERCLELAAVCLGAGSENHVVRSDGLFQYAKKLEEFIAGPLLMLERKPDGTETVRALGVDALAEAINKALFFRNCAIGMETVDVEGERRLIVRVKDVLSENSCSGPFSVGPNLLESEIPQIAAFIDSQSAMIAGLPQKGGASEHLAPPSESPVILPPQPDPATTPGNMLAAVIAKKAYAWDDLFKLAIDPDCLQIRIRRSGPGPVSHKRIDVQFEMWRALIPNTYLNLDDATFRAVVCDRATGLRSEEDEH